MPRRCHSALAAGARVVGVNNRDLRTFEVDLNTCLRLRDRVPVSIPFVAESGIRTPEDIEQLRGAGVNAVLIGETLMRSPGQKGGSGYPAGRKQPMKHTAVKICGLTRPEDAEAVNAVRPDYAGFVFAESRRQVDAAAAALLRERLDPAIRTTGVFVNESTERLVELCRRGIIGLIQLHGDEPEETARHLREETGVLSCGRCAFKIATVF